MRTKKLHPRHFRASALFQTKYQPPVSKPKTGPHHTRRQNGSSPRASRRRPSPPQLPCPPPSPLSIYSGLTFHNRSFLSHRAFHHHAIVNIPPPVLPSSSLFSLQGAFKLTRHHSSLPLVNTLPLLPKYSLRISSFPQIRVSPPPSRKSWNYSSPVSPWLGFFGMKLGAEV
jgi:hypothetical protein